MNLKLNLRLLITLLAVSTFTSTYPCLGNAKSRISKPATPRRVDPDLPAKTVLAEVISKILEQVDFSKVSMDVNVYTGLILDHGILSLVDFKMAEADVQVGFKKNMLFQLDTILPELPNFEGLPGWKPVLEVGSEGIQAVLGLFVVNVEHQKPKLIAKLAFAKNEKVTHLKIAAKNDMNPQLFGLQFQGIEINLAQFKTKNEAKPGYDIKGVCLVKKEVNTMLRAAPIKIVDTDCGFTAKWVPGSDKFETHVMFKSKSSEDSPPAGLN